MSTFPIIDTESLYTCIGKGGRYRIVSLPTGAGKSKDMGQVIIYESIEDDTLPYFWRFYSDFMERMEIIEE